MCYDLIQGQGVSKATPRIWQCDLAPKVRDGQNSSGKSSEAGNKAGFRTKTPTLWRKVERTQVTIAGTPKTKGNPDVEGSCPCCAGLASLARVPNPDRREESHVGARRRGDMIHVYKIMSKIDRVDPEALFESADHTGTRGHSPKLFRKRSRFELRANSFSQRIVNDWNSLPKSVVSTNPHPQCFQVSFR